MYAKVLFLCSVVDVKAVIVLSTLHVHTVVTVKLPTTQVVAGCGCQDVEDTDRLQIPATSSAVKAASVVPDITG
ncbi:hypothetical protein MAR_019994 [Mya arenaria]|uniref:Secreted protein n=1 Tax=Mya arenaria TaxID=6604 RepID=A0ABY7E3R8_MYAAR|nr:hypothetical protein MAR_019994 [Mya arenaria]